MADQFSFDLGQCTCHGIKLGLSIRFFEAFNLDNARFKALLNLSLFQTGRRRFSQEKQIAGVPFESPFDTQKKGRNKQAASCCFDS